MDPIIPQPETVLTPETHKHFLNKKFIITFVVLILLGTGAYAGIWYWQNQQLAQEVAPTFTPRADETADWKTFNSKYFNISFEYPNGYEVYDSQNYIAVAKDKYQTYQNEVANGDNAFFQIRRFSQNYTKEQILQNKAWLENPALLKISVDGSEFTKIEGTRLGGEVYQYGKMIDVVFDASNLVISQFSNSCSENNDCFTVGSQILSTFKFTDSVDTSTWKTYTNTRVGYQFEYPGVGLTLALNETIKYLDTQTKNQDLVQFATNTKDVSEQQPIAFGVRTYVGVKNTSIESWIQSDGSSGNPDLANYTKRSISDQTAYMGKGISVTYVLYNGNVYVIDAHSGIEPARDTDPVYTRFLTSFKFTK